MWARSSRSIPSLLNTLLDTSYIPVVAPIAIDRFGGSLNINADTAAGDIAIALKAYKLVNMTDVDGVMDKDRTKVFRKLTIDEANELQKSGAIGSRDDPESGVGHQGRGKRCLVCAYHQRECRAQPYP